MIDLTKPKEKKEVVFFNRRDGRIQQIRLPETFSLARQSFDGQKVKGYNTFPDRMEQIGSTISGPAPTYSKLAASARLVIVTPMDQLTPGLVKSMERAYEDA